MSYEAIHERLDALLKSPYDEQGEVWNALLIAIAEEFHELEKARAQAETAQFVTSASGEELDRVATVFNLERKRNEPDDVFRTRIQVALRSQTTSATINEVREVVSVLLGIPQGDVSVEEPHTLEPSHMNLKFPGGSLNDTDISDTEFIASVEKVVAAGVSVGILVERDITEVLAIGDSQSVTADQIGVFYNDDENGWNASGYNVDGFEYDRTHEDTGALVDYETVGDAIPGNGTSMVVADGNAVESDQIGPMYWDEGRWDVDHYNE